MKNIFLGIVGVFFTVYLVLLGMDLYDVQIQKACLDSGVAQAIEHVLEKHYGTDARREVQIELEQQLQALGLQEESPKVMIENMDLEKGLLQVSVSQNVTLITGDVKDITIEKTAIVERIHPQEEKVKVSFLVDGEVYKVYELTQGEVCPLPKPPSTAFGGWVEYGTESIVPVEGIGEVWEDKVFLAIAQ